MKKKIILLLIVIIIAIGTLFIKDSNKHKQEKETIKTEKQTEVKTVDRQLNETLLVMASSPTDYIIKENNVTEEAVTVVEEEVKEEFIYTTTKVNIRKEPSEQSEILFTALPNTKLFKVDNINGWHIILLDNVQYYVLADYTTTVEPAEIAPSTTEQRDVLNSELRYMSAIIYAEARGQCLAGQQAVGIIVKNRMITYDDTIKEILYAKGQFTPVRNGSLDKALAIYDRGEMPTSCIEAAKYALEGNTVVNYNNVNYDLSGFLYFSRYVKGCRLVIQDHQFK